MDLLQVRKIISFLTMLTCYNICFNINSFEHVTYFIFKIISSYAKQEVPGIKDLTSLTSILPKKMTKIDYYRPTHQPITQYETVQEVLNCSEEATRVIGQTYTINTFYLQSWTKYLEKK